MLNKAFGFAEMQLYGGTSYSKLEKKLQTTGVMMIRSVFQKNYQSTKATSYYSNEIRVFTKL